MILRIGNGFDVHALVAGRRLVLGGVDVPHERGLDGHSDADVLLHAICDAILGALALGDLGAHFPDTDPRWKGADSRVLLRHVAALSAARGWRIGNRRRDGDRAGAEARAARAGDAREHRRRPRLRPRMRSASRRRRPSAWDSRDAARASRRWRRCCWCGP